MRENFWLGITTFIEENQPITDSVIVVIIVIENLLILSLTYLSLVHVMPEETSTDVKYSNFIV